MSSPRLPLSSRSSFLPDEISRREFATVFRGYDPAEVRTFLNQLAEQSADSSDRVAEVQKTLAETEDRIKNPELDEETVTRLLGEQTAQILRSAREAANEIRAKAEDEIGRQLREAHEVTTRMREEAEALLSERTDEAERAAQAIRSAIEQEVVELKAKTENEMLALRQQTQSDLVDERARARAQMRDLIDLARAESQSLVESTQAKQSELIEGLVRKRKIALAQVEELRAGRGRLLDAYKMVRTTLDEVTVELGRAEDEAREQATAAGARSASESGIGSGDLDSVVDIEEFTLQDDVSDEVIDLINGDSDDFPSGGGGADYRAVGYGGEGSVAMLEQQDLLIAEEDDAEEDAAELRIAGEIDGALNARRDAVVSKARSQTTRRLKRAMQDEQDAVVAQLRSGKCESVQAVIGSIDDQIAGYQRAVQRLFREVVRTGTQSVDGGAQVDRSVIDRAGTAAAREFVAELISDLRSRIVSIIENELSSGVSDINEIQYDIAQPYRKAKGEHLEALIEERVGGAFDQGVALAQVGHG